MKSSAPTVVEVGSATLILSDFAQASLDVCPRFHTIITDPPYSLKEFPESAWASLALFAQRSLYPGGSLLTILPHYAIPVLVPLLSGYLKYRWLLAMWQGNGPHPRMAMGIEVLWKPIGWWVKDRWPSGRGFRPDGFVNAPKHQPQNRYQQADTWGRYCLRFNPRMAAFATP